MKIWGGIKWLFGGLLAAFALFWFGSKSGEDRVENEHNKQRIKGIKAAEQDYDDAKNQDDDDLADRLTAGRKLR